jgi:hypothetical protein
VSNQGFSELALQPLAPSDYSMVMAKSRENRLTFATWLMFFRDHGRFPRGPSDLESLDIAALARQIEVTVPADGGLLLAERTAKRLRTEIRVRYGFREATVADADSLTEWLRDHAAAEAGGEIAAMVERLETRCRELAIEPPSVERVERIARAALRAHEERFHADIYGRLSPAIRERLDELLGSAEGENATGSAPATLLTLCGNPGRPSLASMQEELAKLELIRGIDLPADLFNHASPRDLERCRRRVAVEAPHELRRHPDAARITWLAAFVYLRARSLTDDLVDLLIETIHRIGARAERKVERELLNDIKRVASLESGVTAKDLAYVRRRYISVDTLRRAIAIVADGTLQARNPAIWGSGTTACASDSKHYGAWDQNLTTQWHVRYGGRGIIILLAR